MAVATGDRSVRLRAERGGRGIVVDRHKIDLAEPLKTLGTYKVAVRVYAGLTPEGTIAVEPKG